MTCTVTRPRRSSQITESTLKVLYILSFEVPPEFVKKNSKVVNAK